MKTIFVENTEARIHLVADYQLRPFVKAASGVSRPPCNALLPGVNEVDLDEWAKAEKHPAVKALIEDGVFKVWRHAFATMPVEEALALIKATVDRVLLEKWFDGEKREPVLKALRAQLYRQP